MLIISAFQLCIQYCYCLCGVGSQCIHEDIGFSVTLHPAGWTVSFSHDARLACAPSHFCTAVAKETCVFLRKAQPGGFLDFIGFFCIRFFGIFKGFCKKSQLDRLNWDFYGFSFG